MLWKSSNGTDLNGYKVMFLSIIDSSATVEKINAANRTRNKSDHAPLPRKSLVIDEMVNQVKDIFIFIHLHLVLSPARASMPIVPPETSDTVTICFPQRMHSVSSKIK
jgi:hypothetical protein